MKKNFVTVFAAHFLCILAKVDVLYRALDYQLKLPLRL